MSIMNISNDKQRHLIIFAFRYALGRATYASQVMVEIISAVWSDLDKFEKELIQREVEQAIKTDRAGMDVDVKEWEKLLSL